MILAMFLAVHASTTQSSTDALQAELALARSTLASVRALVPRLQAATASELTSMPGYQGYTFVGASAAIEKSITVVLWGTSAVTPVIRNLTLQQPVDRLSVRVERVQRDSFVLTVKRVDGKVGWGQEIGPRILPREALRGSLLRGSPRLLLARHRPPGKS